TQISPGNGTTGLPLTPALTWNAASGSAGYNVYLGTTNPPTSSTVTSNLSFTPATPLIAGATYYWKVASRDPNNNNAESPSPIWSFTTAAPPPAPTPLAPGTGARTGASATPSAWYHAGGGTAYRSVLLATTTPAAATIPTTSPVP